MINIIDGQATTALDVLKRNFGYDKFRAGQENLINGILTGRDILGVMPTGAGKSLCFQIPALMMDGTALIISPLISLMKDQVNALTRSGVPAAYINSSLTQVQIEKAMWNALNGAYKLIYIAPERLFTGELMTLARHAKISMIAVDEAHCISKWGQDFRPSYAQIPEFIENLPARPVVSAFTATATPKVREDIMDLLKLNNPLVLISGFDRQNLYFDVLKPQSKYEALTKFLNDRKEHCGIVYCMTRKMVELVCKQLRADGYSASRYHAGLDDSERRNNQDDFLHNRTKIMVATNAFGMGIDKSNVSFVIHYNMPKDLESYYQEAGRAGRTGEPADCIIFYSRRDVRINRWMIENEKDVQYSDPDIEKQLKTRNLKRLRDMTLYCTTNDCLRGFILKYFGEKPEKYCGNCTNCNAITEMVDITADAQQIFSHIKWMNSRFEPKHQREVMNYLISCGYLIKTKDRYQVLTLGKRSEKVLRGKMTVKIVFAAETNQRGSLDDFYDTKERKKRQKNKVRELRKTSAPKPKKPEQPAVIDKDLSDALEKVRLRISIEQNTPALSIFSNNAITDMCVKLPKTEKEFLNITGVGKAKLKRYGDQFLSVIAKYHDAIARDELEAPWVK